MSTPAMRAIVSLLCFQISEWLPGAAPSVRTPERSRRKRGF
ncbi:MAG: hypothetical protein HSCHL_2611 [Hydrogenibacillus schlegelii]|uniref:Uncharacterized protein n=1 Tax=Hydrogenibacillus schlegelii TaxID=1484 RepID=A0A2T5G9H8_HYDSH|nr:MAG: hypothetical protein HSCHL_2611 [Hydrogenibacillus schlegelii]